MILIKFYMIKDGFYFSDKHSYLIPYNDFSKRIMRNYKKIKLCMFNDLSKRHKVEYTDFKYMDFLVDGEKYLKIMLFIDISHLAILKSFIELNPIYEEKIYFVCFRENAKRIKKCIPNCNTIIIDESTIEGFLEKDYCESKRFSSTQSQGLFV